MARLPSASEMVSTVAHALQRREKPSASSPVKWIVGGSVTGTVLLVVIGVSLWFHFRRRKRDKQERDKELQELDDYGLADYSSGGGGGAGASLARDDDEPQVTAWPQRGQSSLKQSGPAGGSPARTGASG